MYVQLGLRAILLAGGASGAAGAVVGVHGSLPTPLRLLLALVLGVLLLPAGPAASRTKPEEPSRPPVFVRRTSPAAARATRRSPAAPSVRPWRPTPPTRPPRRAPASARPLPPGRWCCT